MFRERGPRNADELPETIERHLGGSLVVAELEREAEQFPLATRESRPGIPSLRRHPSDGPKPVSSTQLVEKTAESWEDPFGQEQGDPCAALAFTDCSQRDDPALRAQSILDGLRDFPFDPRDIFPAFSARGHQLEPGKPISPDEGTGFAANRIEIFEGPAPADPDDKGEHLRAHREGLEDVDGLVVAEERPAQDSEVFEDLGRDDDVEVLHRSIRLTGKPLTG